MTMPQKLHLIYFSPTGTTRKTVEQIAAGMEPVQVESHDLTLLTTGLEQQFTDGLAIIGIPVYAGRVPEICLKRMERVSAQGVPAILVALYGNREFEDALVELQDVVITKGFTVVAAAAFIGEHSYSTQAQPIAEARPDQDDLAMAREFGTAVAHSLVDGIPQAVPAIPGNRPYRERPPLGGIAPALEESLCTRCAVCATVCPTLAITAGEGVVTDASSCILCCACVRICPAQARSLNHPLITARREMLVTNCSVRKSPSLYR